MTNSPHLSDDHPAVVGCLLQRTPEVLDWLTGTGVAPDMAADITRPYEDSTPATCERCQRGIWIGPQQREHLAQLLRGGANPLTFCMPCTVIYSAEQARHSPAGAALHVQPLSDTQN